MESFNGGFRWLLPDRKVDFVGREKELEDVLYRVCSGSLFVIEGEYGSGRTELLGYIIGYFRGYGKVIYLDASRYSKRLDISDLVKGKENMILLIDNIESLSFENNEKIKYYFDQNNIRSVVFTTNSFDSVNFSESVLSRIGRNVLKLKKMTDEELLEIGRMRIPKRFEVSDEILNSIIASVKNVGDFLLTCDELCSVLNDNEKSVAELSDLKSVKIKYDKEDDVVNFCSDCGSEITCVNGKYRCQKCDRFCLNCGELLKKKEVNCLVCENEKKKN